MGISPALQFHRLLFVVWAFSILAAPVGQLFAADKPNVLFLFADDFTYEAVSAFGHTDIETPNLDKLAARGTTFTHAYNMGSWSGAVCVASRNMLLTGRSVWRAEKIAGSTEKERQAGRLWPQLMAQAGYDTYMTGKWHIQA
ncbi:MAG: sulfatase-like hydrolase/transferase, partial [Pirellulaceae bacterium]|nr:sulfatase-like hydrolase/transferase [Pirellulaceae bacterium]